MDPFSTYLHTHIYMSSNMKMTGLINKLDHFSNPCQA